MGVEAPATYEVIGDGSRRRCPARTRRSRRWSTRRCARGPSWRRRDRPAARAGADEQGDRRPLLARPSPPRPASPTPAATSTTWSGTGAAASRSPGRSSRAAWCARPVREGSAQSAALRAADRHPPPAGPRRRRPGAAGRSSPARRRCRAAERSLANAKARLDLAEVRYRTGVGNGIELSDAQLAATSAAFQQLQATLKLDTARAQLLKALGRP